MSLRMNIRGTQLLGVVEQDRPRLDLNAGLHGEMRPMTEQDQQTLSRFMDAAYDWYKDAHDESKDA